MGTRRTDIRALIFVPNQVRVINYFHTFDSNSIFREEALSHRIPTRLQELVKQYPYSRYAVEGDNLLPRPRFSTRRYDALFVHVDTELPASGRGAKEHPLRLIAEAFNAQSSQQSGSDGEVWDRIKKAADQAEEESSAEGQSALNKIFADETVSLLNRIPAEAPLRGTKTPVATPTPRSASPVRGRSFYSADKANGNVANGSSNVGADHDRSTLKVPTSVPLPPSPVTPDWAAFSTSGFGESPQPLAFLDKDVEKDKPVRRKSSKRRQKSATRQPKTSNTEVTTTHVSAQQDDEKELVVSRPSVTTASFIQLDEAFIDFWSDALLDPISADWPAFVICKLKPLANEEKPVSWLVIERTYSPSPSQIAAISEAQGKKRAASPRPSFKSGGTFGATKKRFSLFGSRSNSTASDKAKKKKHGEKVGEMGEILDEEVEKSDVKKADEKAVEAAMASDAVTPAAKELKEPKADLSVKPIPEAVKPVDEQKIESKPVDLPPEKSHAATPPEPLVTETPAPLTHLETKASAPKAVFVSITPRGEVQKVAEEPPAHSAPKPANSVEPKDKDVVEPQRAPKISGTITPAAKVQKVAEEPPAPRAPKPASSVEPKIKDVAEPQQVSEPSLSTPTVTKEDEVRPLPGAPETVVLAGDTPGPQVALSTSEPVAIAQAVERHLGDSEGAETQPTVPVSDLSSELPESGIPPANGSSIVPIDPTPPPAAHEPEPEPVADLVAIPIVDTKPQPILPVEESTAPEPKSDAAPELPIAASATEELITAPQIEGLSHAYTM
jgi:hypothetical protein